MTIFSRVQSCAKPCELNDTLSSTGPSFRTFKWYIHLNQQKKYKINSDYLKKIHFLFLFRLMPADIILLSSSNLSQIQPCLFAHDSIFHTTMPAFKSIQIYCETFDFPGMRSSVRTERGRLAETNEKYCHFDFVCVKILYALPVSCRNSCFNWEMRFRLSQSFAVLFCVSMS